MVLCAVVAFGANAADSELMDVSLLDHSAFSGQAIDIFSGDFKNRSCLELENSSSTSLNSKVELPFHYHYSNSRITSYRELMRVTSSGLSVGKEFLAEASKTFLGTSSNQIWHIRLEFSRDRTGPAPLHFKDVAIQQLSESITGFRRLCGFGYLDLVREGYVLDIVLIERGETSSTSKDLTFKISLEIDQMITPILSALKALPSASDQTTALTKQLEGLALKLRHLSNEYQASSVVDLRFRSNIDLQNENKKPGEGPLGLPDKVSDEQMAFTFVSQAANQRLREAFASFSDAVAKRLNDSQVRHPAVRAKYLEYHALPLEFFEKLNQTKKPDRMQMRLLANILEVGRVSKVRERVDLILNYADAFLSSHKKADIWGRRRNAEKVRHYFASLSKYLTDLEEVCAKSDSYLAPCTALVRGVDLRKMADSEFERSTISELRLKEAMLLGQNLQCSDLFDFDRVTACLDRGFHGAHCIYLKGTKYTLEEVNIVPFAREQLENKTAVPVTDINMAGIKLKGHCTYGVHWDEMPLRGPQFDVIWGLGIFDPRHL